MPQSAKKRICDKDSIVSQCEDSNCSSTAGATNSVLNNSNNTNNSCKSRKRKRCDIVRFSDLESEFEDCDLEDAAALETKLRKVARRNSLTHDEMMKLLHKFVKNEHILALVTLKAEDALAKEQKKNEEQRAIIITETPSVPKLTRAKARELNKTPVIKLPSLKKQETEPEIAALIKEDLHSDEEDEEYVFKEEDFVSDDDPNTTASDLESNPRTPQTPASQNEDSPVKLSEDGCFKVPLSKKIQELNEELRIAARTRSKLCLEQTTIEDLQSEFVPPDVEEPLECTDLQPLDEDWMQFLNDFTKPLNASLVADDDDPINDPEYVAAEKEPVDAEELRDVNISKKELSELVAELYDGLMTGGLSMESIDLETPRKFLENYQDERLNTPNYSPERLENNLDVSRQLNFENVQNCSKQLEQTQSDETNVITTTNNIDSQQVCETHTETNIISSTHNQHNYSFQPDIMSTPSSHNKSNQNSEEFNNKNSDNMALIPIAQTNNTDNPQNSTIVITSNSLNTQLDLIAVPIPGQPNCFQLARVVDTPGKDLNTVPVQPISDENTDIAEKENTVCKPNYINYNSGYISVQRHIVAEYIEKFKNLQHAQDNKISSTTDTMEPMPQNTNPGLTQYQYDLMQQQLRIHIQQLSQTFVQTYCHPDLWKLAPKSKELLLDLQEKAKTNVNLKVWNLESAIELTQNWQKELDVDTPENTELMNFLNREIYATANRSRQIPRFHPRIIECYLNSPVFMYPQYLPRMPFASKPSNPIFSPEESYLIAMGLEKHLQLIYDNKEKISYKTTPLRVACKRLARDTMSGKRFRRIWQHILYLKDVDYYNPIKYFFEHNRAPPVEHDPVWTFDNNVVLAPKDRVSELPSVYQHYLQKKNEQPNPKNNGNKKSCRKRPAIKVSEAFRNSYLEFVQEAVGQDLPTPNLFFDPAESSDTPLSEADVNTSFAEKRRKLLINKPLAKRKLPQSLTINVNYVYGSGLDISTTSNSSSLGALAAPPCNIKYSDLQNNNLTQVSKNNTSENFLYNTAAAEISSTSLNTSNNNIPDSTINSTIDLIQGDKHNTTSNTEVPVITYNFDWRTKTLQPAFDKTILQSQTETSQCTTPTPKHTTKSLTTIKTSPPPPALAPINNYLTYITPNPKDKLSCNLQKSQKFNKKLKASKKLGGAFKLNKRIKQKASAYREKRLLQRRCEELITAYSLHLDTILQKYKNQPLIQRYHRHLKALELYTKLLKGLKLFCLKHTEDMAQSSNNSPSTLKRTRNSNSNTEDESSPSSARHVRKLNRQEENFRHMLLPDTPEEANRKDAIYAFNFYEKVEEAFKTSNKPEDCKKFNAILKSFDPKKDKVSDLYYKLEKLFLPDHPELAQVFLTFLLPSEAAEIGKFFEHFMINNMTTFINKLNIYFNKQPAQIRKIYNCLNDLAEDPDVTMKKVESKIIPLLKGNQFLIDWFMQQFPQNPPPERLFSNPEHINLKDQQSNRSGEHVETITDVMDSPTNDGQQQQSCQLRYINGRIFYGSKMLLPAKLSFMAASYKNQVIPNESAALTAISGCVHGIREHGEKRLQAAQDLTSTHTNAAEVPFCDDQEKSEEEDVSKTLVIDTTADEDDSCSSVELCDEATLRAHANRLNPSVYSSTCYSSVNATSTPHLTNNFQSHHPNAKKTSLNFHEEVKLSPRKNYAASSANTQSHVTSSLTTAISNSPINLKERRKSPNKKTRSPLNNTNQKSLKTNNVGLQPMVVIHETNSAIQCAKRLKSLISEEGQTSENTEEVLDSKEIIQIVARTKNSMQPSEIQSSATTPICDEVKEEDLEFLAEDSALSPSPFPSLRMETDEEDAYSSTTPTSAAPPPPPTSQTAASDEDCKIDIVTSFTTNTEATNTSTPSATEKSQTILPLNAAWTRDEDKIILIEMKLGSQNRQELHQRIAEKLPNRTMFEITSRHQFLMDFLSKLQGK
ncbi:gon-4 like protein muscle wasted isoform 2-T2 [Cochliomyia hominivorax]